MHMQPYIHDVLENNESSAFGFWLIPYSQLTYASISSEQFVQVVPRDLIVQILDKKNPVGTRRKLGLSDVIE